MTHTVSITTYFDAFGDGKSERKVFKRRRVKVQGSREQIVSELKRIDALRGYYDGISYSVSNTESKMRGPAKHVAFLLLLTY